MENFILPSTARLAKTKGTNWNDLVMEIITGNFHNNYCYNTLDKFVQVEEYNEKADLYPALTQDQLKRYLSQKYHIEILFDDITKVYSIVNQITGEVLETIDYYNQSTYEEVLVKALNHLPDINQ